MQCTICGGPLCYIGTLGGLEWFRCQNCGMDQSFNRDEHEQELEESDED